MNELIKTTEQTPIELALGIDEEGYTTSRKLYQFLELDPSHYSRWCNRNIVKNPFAEEGVDYWMENSPRRASLTGKRNTKDYKLSANFSKKLSMTCQTAKGEAAREYFLTCERLLKESIERERFKYSLLTLSKEAKFAYLHPKFAQLEESLNISRKELYSLIFKSIEKNYRISISEETVKYCIDHHIPSCYPMTVLEDVPQLFLYLYDTVDSMLKETQKTLSVTTIESIA